MINKLILVLLIKIFSFSIALASHNNEPYNFWGSERFEVKGSENF